MVDLIFIGDLIETPVLTSCQIEPETLLKCQGEIGNFTLSIEEAGVKKELKAGAIVVNIPADKEKAVPQALSFEELDLEELDEKEPLIFIQDYLSLSAAIMSKEGLNKAITIAEKNPKIDIYYFYRSMRFTATDKNLFEKARKLGIVFLKYEKEGLSISENSVSYEREDISLDLKGKLIMAPLLKPAQVLAKVAKILNVKKGDNDYLQVENVYLQPTRSEKRGVYVLGGSRGPGGYSNFENDLDFTLNEIKSLLREPKAVTDEERKVDEDKCVFCYTCYRICPHGALEPDYDLDAMQVLNLACQGCNACISHCPAEAISIVGEKEEKRETGLKVLLCQNSAELALAKLDEKDFADLNLETIPCAGSISKGDIFRYLQDPSQRLLIIGCFPEACQHLTGDEKAKRIVNEVNERLGALNLGKDRVSFIQLSPRMEADLAGILSQWKEENL